jgi:hypothetical protein
VAPATLLPDFLSNILIRTIAAGAKQFMMDCMMLDPAQLPDDITSLKAMLLAENKRANEAETRAKDLDAEIEHLKLTIANQRGFKRREVGNRERPQNHWPGAEDRRPRYPASRW